MTIESKKIITHKTHPMEEFMNIEPNSTEVVRTEMVGESVKTEQYDEKDTEIDGDYQTIANKALEGFESLREIAEDGDAKFVARTSEVAAQFLGIALDALNKKAHHKQHKDKINQNKKSGNGKTVNNTVIINRNDLLSQIRDDGLVIDADSQIIDKD